MKTLKKALVVVVLVLTGVGQALASERDERLKQIEKQIEVLTEEVEKLRLGAVAEPEYKSYTGLGPAASKVYGVEKGLSIGGYAELTYANYQHSSKNDLADIYRFILYTGYKFSDWIVMNTELEFEHAGIGNVEKRSSETTVEFMYLDFMLSKPFNIRTGYMLMPIGFINEYHEPTVYYGSFRPDIETYIIPSTWSEIGVMAYGSAGNLSYKAAIVNGLRADLFKSSSWIKGGRQKAAKINADRGAALFNLNYAVTPGIIVGGTYYHGLAGSGKGGVSADSVSQPRKGTVKLWEVHAEARIKAVELRALYTEGSIDGNSWFNGSGIGKGVKGWYLEGAVDVLTLLALTTEYSLQPFVRYEKYDLNDDVFAGDTPDKTLDRTVTTVGVSFKPHPNVVLKADYQMRDTASALPEGKGSGLDEYKIDQFNAAIGFLF